MINEIIRNIKKYFLSSLSLQLSNLISLYMLMKALDVNDYGAYYYVVELVAIFSIFIESGTRSYYIKKIAESGDKETALANIINIHAVLTLITFFISFLYVNLINYDYRILIFISIGYLLSTLYVPFQAYYISNEKVNVITIREQVIGISRVVYFAYGMIKNMPVLYFLSYVYLQFALLSFYWLVVNKSCGLNLYNFKFNPKLAFKGCLELIPFTVLIVVNLVYNKIDIYMLEMYSSFDAVGIYTAATKLVYPFMFISSVFMTAVFPRMVKNRGCINDINKITVFSLRALLVFGSFFSFILFISADFIFKNIDSGKFIDSLDVFKVMVLYLPIVFTYGVLTNLMVSGNLIKPLVYINLFGLALNVILNAILIPSHGPVGAAVSTILCETLIFLFAVYFSKFKIGVDFKIKTTCILIIFILVVFVYALSNIR